VIFGFIAAKKAEHPIKTMCRVLGVSRSGFHAWQSRPPSARSLEDERLTERIRQIHKDNRQVYGSPRIHAELVLAGGEKIGRKRVERLMRQAAIAGTVRKKRGRTTIRVPGVRVREDLVDRAFLAAAPNRLWVADITYLRTWEGWLYLVAVQDVFSRRIVGWSMADHMRTELVTDALQMALAQRRPEPGLIWHSDQGSQFVSLAFGQQARAAGIAQSMGSKGDCFDNAIAESFFATLKKELIHGRSWPTKAELRTEIFEYIEVFFNRRRRHSTLGMLSPADYENSTLSDPGASLAASRLASNVSRRRSSFNRLAGLEGTYAVALIAPALYGTAVGGDRVSDRPVACRGGGREPEGDVVRARQARGQADHPARGGGRVRRVAGPGQV
jgi:putative transposase